MTEFKRRKAGKKKVIPKLSIEDKYRMYEESVQNPEGDLEIINREYFKIFKKKPLLLREDFSGTSLLSHHWVKQGEEYKAFAVDLDPVPLDYGIRNHSSGLSHSEKQRLKIIQGNVLDPFLNKVDVVVAFNFSYFIFKKREDLLNYFKAVKKSIGDNGVFIIDLFGGTEAFQEFEEKTKFKKHIYHWDCKNFNPITGECLYYIHFKVGNHKFEKVFTYDWRMWGIPELCEIMKDAGLGVVTTFWEGDDGIGGGNGEFYATKDAENCQSWVTYILARNTP